MAKAPAFQLYAADFYMDTVGWTATEVGAYFRLLLHEWVDGPLPDDIMRLARIAGVDHKTMGKFWALSVGKKFVKTGIGTWENSRLEQTRLEQEEYKQKLMKSGRLGGLKTQEEKRKSSSEALSKASSENEALLSSSSTSSSVLDKTTLEDDNPNGLLSPKDFGNEKSNGHCPHVEIIKLYHEILPSLQKVKEWTEQRQKILRTRWNEKEERQTLEWWHLFFQYVSESDFLMGRIKPEFQAELEWLVRPKNFVKVIEGKYHRQGNAMLSASSVGIMGWADRERERMKKKEVICTQAI
jgi:uncharacterized protein YdaU (DUF1376 family)